MIADGRLAQGDKLLEIPLSEALGVSRNTLRDALHRLGAEGLVEHELHRGAVVRKLTTRDIVDIYAIRRMLELEGIRALPDSPVTARSKLREALDRLDEALAAGSGLGTSGLRDEGRFCRSLAGVSFCVEVALPRRSEP